MDEKEREEKKAENKIENKENIKKTEKDNKNDDEEDDWGAVPAFLRRKNKFKDLTSKLPNEVLKNRASF